MRSMLRVLLNKEKYNKAMNDITELLLDPKNEPDERIQDVFKALKMIQTLEELGVINLKEE